MHLFDHPVLLALESIAVRAARPVVQGWWWLTGTGRKGLVLVLVGLGTIVGLVGAAAQFASATTAGMGPSFLQDPTVRRTLTVAITVAALLYISRFIVRIADHADRQGPGDGEVLDALSLQARVARALLTVLTVVQAVTAFPDGLVAGLASTGAVALFALAVGATAGDPPAGRTVADLFRVERAVPIPTA